ncbi:hypothetical protein L7F22_061608 [Adiantum nelumboides]|nr:hypothetical protein [Adiantum nelumboides]
MEENGIHDREAVDGFHLIMVPELRTRIVELQTQQGTDWPECKKALKGEYFLEDSQRVTKQSFMKWINQKNKGLSAGKLLREFEKKYEQLSSTEQRSIKSKRVELFVQAADARLQKSLVQLLEDAIGDLGLNLDWKLILEAVNMIVKCQIQVDKLIVADASDTSDEESKDKPTSSKHKLKEPVLDDLVKAHGKVVRPELTKKQKQELKECFDLIDADGSGAIDAEELVTAFNVLGMRVKKSEVEKMLAEVDADGSGEVEYPEFVQIMTSKLDAQVQEGDLEGRETPIQLQTFVRKTSKTAASFSTACPSLSEEKGDSVPLVSASAVPRLMKQHIFAYLIYVKERDETESSNLSSLDVSRRAFLDEYANCFSEALPDQLPLERSKDHNIDLIPFSATSNPLTELAQPSKKRL